jgi:hypothetical protein
MTSSHAKDMNNIDPTHWRSFPWRIGYISLGTFILLIVVGTFIVNAQDIISREMAFLEILGIIMLLALIYPMSVIIFARPFLIKVVVRSSGLEYHSTFFVLQGDWKNLANIGYIKNTNAGKILVVVPREGNLTFRKWAKLVPRNIFSEYPKDIHDVQILVSQFRASNGHSFETNVLVNLSQTSDSNESLESL